MRACISGKETRKLATVNRSRVTIRVTKFRPVPGTCSTLKNEYKSPGILSVWCPSIKLGYQTSVIYADFVKHSTLYLITNLPTNYMLMALAEH